MMMLLSAAARVPAARAAARLPAAIAAGAATRAGSSGGSSAEPPSAGASWASRGERAADAAGQTAERAAGAIRSNVASGEAAPEFGLHKTGALAGGGAFDLSSLADAIRGSWGGRADEAAKAVAAMVRDPSVARRLPSPPPPSQKAAAAKKAEDEGEGEEGEPLGLPLRWRRMTPDAGVDEWYELPSSPPSSPSSKQ